MKPPPSRTISRVERALGELRRGGSVLLSGTGNAPLLVRASEYMPGEPALTDPAHPAVRLMKLAGLLPGAVVLKRDAEAEEDAPRVAAENVGDYPEALAEALEKVSEAIVPFESLGEARVIAFRPRGGHQEDLAIVAGDPASLDAPYVRIHSSCVTGDALASLRCDCGDQLRAAKERIAEQKAGVILYLNQEGRGIGIANKLRAYALQDRGLDTVEANEALGFKPDERDFALAAAMLRALRLKRITLLTNNPRKMTALSDCGIEIARREGLVILANEHNRRYLAAKAEKLGHQF